MSAAPPPCRVILVGCGAVARHCYVPALRALQKSGAVRVSAIVDPSGTAREAVARNFPRAGQAAALEQTTAPAGTLVIIASPPAFRAAQAITAIERGWHVLCEAPMAASSAEAVGMIAAAQDHQRLLAVGLYKRFFPASRYLYSLCRDWVLGPLLHFSICEGGPFRWPVGPSFFDRAHTRGGVLFDLGLHTLDLLGWWFGVPGELRYADDAMGGLEANAFVELAFDDGARGRVHLSRDWATGNHYRFVFERGIVVWRANHASGLSVQLAGAPSAVHGALFTRESEPPLRAAPQPLETNGQCFTLQLRNVVAAVAGSEPLGVPGAEGLAALRLVERCYATRALVDQPWLTPAEAGRAHEISATLSPAA